MSTVPMFAPNGDLGDIPAERVADARKAGFTVGVNVQSADGKPGVIPAHRTADAVKAGMKIVPIEDQPSQHPGFLSALGDTLGGMLKSAAPPTTKEGLLAKAKMFKEVVTGPDPKEFLQNAIDRMNSGQRFAGPAYASVAGMGQQLGADVPGMEQSAQQGDVGGVLGHAAAQPLVMGTGMALGELPLGRIAKAGGSALQGGAERLPIVGPVAKGAIRGALKSWRASAPDVEIPASRVSTTPPESVSKSTQLQQARALQNVPVPAQVASGPQTGPIPAVRDMSTVLPRLRAIAQQIQAQEATAAPESGSPLRIAGKEAPPNTELTPALEKSIPPNRIQGKIMQVVRREGTLGMDRLMKAPELQGLSREQVEGAAMDLGKSEKLWVPTKEADAHGPAGIISLALRKR